MINKTPTYLSKTALESSRKVLRRKLTKGSKIWVLPNLKIKINKKSKGARMGKGVGKPKGYSYFLDKGTNLFEIWDIAYITNSKLNFACNKLPINCKIHTNTKDEII